jgi:hypothetical protein
MRNTVSIILVALFFCVNLYGGEILENKQRIIFSFHVVSYISDAKLRLMSYPYPKYYAPFYIGKLKIYKDYSATFNCSEGKDDYCAFILSRIKHMVEEGITEFSYNTIAKTAEEFPVRISYCKGLSSICCKKEDYCFNEMLIKDIFEPNEPISYRYIDNEVGEKYLKNGWSKEQRKDELVNATVLMPGDKIMRNYILFKKTLRELPLTEEQKKISDKEMSFPADEVITGRDNTDIYIVCVVLFICFIFFLIIYLKKKK